MWCFQNNDWNTENTLNILTISSNKMWKMESKLSECVHKIRMISNTQHIVVLVPFTLKNLLKSFYTLYE